MNRLIFYVRYALRSLRRDSTRSFLAALSVAFGVLSLVAMQLLAHTLLSGAMFEQSVQYGGDAMIEKADYGQPFRADDLAQIEAWQQQGLIADYSMTSTGSAAYLRTPSSGRVTILNSAMGIDPAVYPLKGELVLRDPAGASAADVLLNPDDVLVTRDIADRLGLHLGDSIFLSGDSTPVPLTVAGIIKAMPMQRGESVVYSLETAALIEHQTDVIDRVSITWGDAPNAEQTLVDSPYRVFVAIDRTGTVESSSSVSLFDMMLKGAGVLGLLIGGLSVSNTLQVILAWRKLEIAMLKTLGYRRFDLLVLISLETGLIGLVGGISGALIGSLIAEKLIDMLGSAGALMIDWQPDPVIVIGGVVAGLLTSVVFGMQAILASSATRPVQLLRDLPLKTSRQTQIGRLSLYAVMLLVFGLLVGVVLGTPLEGILYVVGGGLAIVVLRTIFWVVLWGVLKLPLPRFPMIRLARANLRQRKMQSSLVVLALFAGAFSVSFAALSIYNAQTTIGRLRGSDDGYNLLIYTTASGEAGTLQAITERGGQGAYVTQRVRATLDGRTVIVEGRDFADLDKEMSYSGAWSASENEALLPDSAVQEYHVGDSLTLDVNGQGQTVTVAGFYTVDRNRMSAQTPPLIVSRQLIENFTDTPLQTRVMGMFPTDVLSETTTALGQILPNDLVFSRADLNDATSNTFQTLFSFAASIAGLAFVAGAVLIANAAGLTVVERRREIGVFKAVGYTSGHVLRVLLSEYDFLGTLAGLSGILAAVIAIIVINIAQPGLGLVVEPTILGSMLLFSIAIAVVSAAVVAWQPTRVRPLDVLRYE